MGFIRLDYYIVYCCKRVSGLLVNNRSNSKAYLISELSESNYVYIL